MDPSISLLCQPSAGQEDDWKNLYEASFPSDERMPVEEIRQLLSKGQLLLHKSYNKTGDMVCFSLVYPVTDFQLLSYIAVDPTKRSGGYGSKHLKRLLEVLKAQYPTHIALFLEIESTKEQGLAPDVQKMRNRRLDFYQRLGAKRMLKNYWCPNLSTPGGAPRQGELLWIELGTAPVDETCLKRVIREIYERAYLLSPADPLIQQVLGQFTAVAPATATTSGGTGGGQTQLQEAANVAVASAPPAATGATSGDSAKNAG